MFIIETASIPNHGISHLYVFTMFMFNIYSTPLEISQM